MRSADGPSETLEARRASSRPSVSSTDRTFPTSPDATTFAGASFHSARWDHSVDYRGKRVAVIGAGASGFQIVPTIAADVAELTVFQRTAQWMFPNPNYHEPVGPGVQWALRHLPFYGRWYRFLLFWPGCDGGLAAARVDPEWPHQDRAVSATNDVTREIFTAWISEQVGDDPELLAKVIPDYPATGKRTLQDNGSWLRALKRPNVELVREGIDHIDAHGIVTRRARATTSTSSCSPPASRPTSSSGRWRSSGATAWGSPSSGATSRRRTSASPCRTSRTCSACTGRARTSRTAAA